jgi:hypothetical protein
VWVIRNPDFLNQPKEFWADIRTIGQAVGYTIRGQDKFKVPTPDEVVKAYRNLGLSSGHLVSGARWTDDGEVVAAYMQYRASVLQKEVKPALMNAEQAGKLYAECKARLNPQGPVPMNKQKGDKKQVSFLTALVNMHIEAEIGKHPCDYDPRELTAITRGGRPLRTLARRVDGAFPSAVNPVAIWEIKEYYYTTTFGSRIADGVYETLLDGMELEELKEHTGIDVRHYLIVDAYLTWWEMGKSYLCRMVDMAHMGYVDEVIFGREVVERVPQLAREWIAALPEAERRAKEAPIAPDARPAAKQR